MMKRLTIQRRGSFPSFLLLVFMAGILVGNLDHLYEYSEYYRYSNSNNSNRQTSSSMSISSEFVQHAELRNKHRAKKQEQMMKQMMEKQKQMRLVSSIPSNSNNNNSNNNTASPLLLSDQFTANAHATRERKSKIQNRGAIGSLDATAMDHNNDTTNITNTTKTNQQPSSIPAFDQLAHIAYQEATNTTTTSSTTTSTATTTSSTIMQKRPTFDLKYWETKSGLITEGGLQSKDRLLLAELYTQANSVFEFGLGESTYLANYLQVPRYSGVDSDPNYVANVRDKVAPHYRFYLADTGPTGAWGMPQFALPKNVMQYQVAPLAAELQAFDVYLVDGRFRLASMLASFLHASSRGRGASRGNTNNTIVAVHDCKTGDPQRRSYERADHLLQLIAHSGSKLCVYQRLPTTTDQQLLQLWKEYHREKIRR